LSRHYGPAILDVVVAGDLFPENSLIRHGFDTVCRDVLARCGSEYLHRHRICEVYMQMTGGKAHAAGVVIENVETGVRTCLPVDCLGLSLGPTATFHFEGESSLSDRLKNRLKIGMPVPYQTIATGMSAQVLFRITDHKKAKILPLTGMKQTHFVEIGRTKTHVLMKLTCGGVIGLPVYSRSYGISALASLLRTMTPETGLQFSTVVCAWPCTRAVNVANNGQVVRLAENCVARFGEGGTGMSKMGTNAQTMLDLMSMTSPLPADLRLAFDLYRHTVIDRRTIVMKRLFAKRDRKPDGIQIGSAALSRRSEKAAARKLRWAAKRSAQNERQSGKAQ
jgi:hypothetical protein